MIINIINEGSFNKINSFNRISFSHSPKVGLGFQNIPDFHYPGLNLAFAKETDLEDIVNLFEKIEIEEFKNINVGEEQYHNAHLELLKKCFNEKGTVIYSLKTDEGQLVGSAVLIDYKFAETTSEKTGFIFDLYLNKEYRYQHIGSFLIKNLLDKSKEFGYKKVLLNVHNPTAKKLYKELGFKECVNDAETQIPIINGNYHIWMEWTA